MITLSSLPFNSRVEPSIKTASGTSTSLDSSHGSSSTPLSVTSADQPFFREVSTALEEQWQTDAYAFSIPNRPNDEGAEGIRAVSLHQNALKTFGETAKVSCLMGIVDGLELGFYSPRSTPRPFSRVVQAEPMAPRRGRLNRVLSRLNFKSTDSRLGNFHRVDAVVLRGAMPEGAADFSHLKHHYNVGTLIDLRGWETSRPQFINYERYQAHQNGMRYLHLPMDSHTPPSLGQLQLFFRVIEKSRQQGQTVYVHCKQGVDRTGALVAAYQVASGKPQAEAFQAMRRHGYNWRHSLTRPAQKAFVLDPALPTLLQKAQLGANLQAQAHALKERGQLDLKTYQAMRDWMAEGRLTAAAQYLASLTAESSQNQQEY